LKIVRIIPRLDVKGPNLVKGINLEGLRVLGTPKDFSKHYYESGADEIIFQDVVASLYNRNSLKDIISQTAQNIFIPITVGGGIRTIKDIKDILRAGADKVVLNTAAVLNPKIIKQACNIFGSSTISIAIEAIKHPNGKYYAFIDNGRQETGVEVVSWAKQIEDFGAGEIIITSVDRDGTGKGYDIDLISLVSKNIKIPIIAHGGASDNENIKNAIIKGGADAICLASILHYEAVKEINLINNSHEEGNTSFLKSGNFFSKVIPNNISSIKNYLLKHDINCRKN
tara:strand:- start:12484 stop:13335 length:852 start_codon:yes stop_codon:yes gene_type:complete